MVLIAKLSVKIMSNVSQMKGWVIHIEGGSSKRLCRCGTPRRGVLSGGLMKTFHLHSNDHIMHLLPSVLRVFVFFLLSSSDHLCTLFDLQAHRCYNYFLKSVFCLFNFLLIDVMHFKVIKLELQCILHKT